MKHNIILSFSVAATLLIAAPQWGYAQKRASKSVRHYVVASATGKVLSVDSTYDVRVNKATTELLVQYKKGVQNMMNTQVGVSAKLMKGSGGEDNPEGLLSDLIADVIRSAGSKILGEGRTCDMALMNNGGVRSILPKGKIMVSNIFEILPFENTITVLTLSGIQLSELLSEIAHIGGGLSGVQIAVTKKTHQLLRATIGGQLIDPNKSYTVATLNYLAEGNDGFKVLAEKSVQRINRDDVLLRDIFTDYVKQQTKEGKEIDANIEGRFTVE